MDDNEYVAWKQATREKLNAKMGPVRDEATEVREKMGYGAPSMPQVELEKYSSPEAARFWGEVEDMRYGTIWNQPKVGDLVTLRGKHGEVIDLISNDGGATVTQARVHFVEDKVSMLVEPWKLEKAHG